MLSYCHVLLQHIYSNALYGVQLLVMRLCQSSVANSSLEKLEHTAESSVRHQLV